MNGSCHRWRQKFLESMSPQHLPMGWSVENPLPEDQDDAGHGLSQVCVCVCVRGSG